MTTTTTAATTTTGDKPIRRFPPPCWTQDEALALIQAYRDRWYALRRGYLRTADWDAVAEHVGRLCPGAVPPKTSAQCRHKMEKLRQRYRAEKQRALSFPGPHFISTWFYFQAMDSMEKNGSNNINNNNNNQDPDTNTNTGIDPVYAGLNPGRGIRFKPVVTGTQTQLVTVASRENNNNNNIRVSHNYPLQEEDNDGEYENNPYYVETPKVQRLGLQNYATRFQPGFQSDRNMENSGIRPRKISKVGLNFNHDDGYWNEVNDGGDDDDDDVWVKMGRDRGSDERLNRGVGRECFDGEFSRGVKRESDDSIGQIVGAIKLLADGFVKMERMKMDMVHEIEKARMEAEMKRNKMLLESQKQIVEAFVKGLSENKKQRQ